MAQHGCTIKAQKELVNAENKIKASENKTVRVNKETPDFYPKFMGKCHFDFPLLSGPASGMIKAYNSYCDKGIFDFNMHTLSKYGNLIKTDVSEFLKGAMA